MITARNGPLRRNNFDLLRLMFAAVVVLVHANDLPRQTVSHWIPLVFSSEMAVKSFFIVSGFLIFMSYENSPTIAGYFSRRARRIYPAYFLVVVLCALYGAIHSGHDHSFEFYTHLAKYLLANLAFLNFLQPTIPGVFETNKLSVINGALWTLKIEVLFYLAVPIAVYLFRRFGRFKILLLIYVASVAYRMLLNDFAVRHESALARELSRQLPGQMSYFAAGGFLYYYFDSFYGRRYVSLAAAVSVLAAALFVPLDAIYPAALAVVVIFSATFRYLGNAGKFGDFSYGIYVLHFPVIQLFVQEGWLQADPIVYLVVVCLVVLGGAGLMWHFVEKTWLYRNSHYVAATSSLAPPARAIKKL